MPFAPSLRQFERPDEEIYKTAGLALDCPRKGDFAEVVKDHCLQETGMLVRVVDYPHWCLSICADCGLQVKEWIVQVEPLTDWLKWHVKAPGGPFFYPINWLKRWDPNVSRIDVRGH